MLMQWQNGYKSNFQWFTYPAKFLLYTESFTHIFLSFSTKYSLRFFTIIPSMSTLPQYVDAHFRIQFADEDFEFCERWVILFVSEVILICTSLSPSKITSIL